jgi:hypothetical protein
LSEVFHRDGETSSNYPRSQSLENFQTGTSSSTANEAIGKPYLSSTLIEKDDSVSAMSLSQAICISLELTENGLHQERATVCPKATQKGTF